MNLVSLKNRISEILTETVDDTNDVLLYHVTPNQNVTSIQQNGVSPTSYWSTADLVAYYSETVEDEGFIPAVFMVRLSDLDHSLIEPDYPGIEEPITMFIGQSEEETWNRWYASGQTWTDSLAIIGSVRYRGVVHPVLEDEA